MTACFLRFQQSSLDTADVGLDTLAPTMERLPDDAVYIGAAQTGEAFCFLPKHGEQVYLAVGSGQFVRVAANFLEFLSLILACKGTQAIVCAHLQTSADFASQIESAKPSYKQRAIFRALRNAYTMPPIDDPFVYLQMQRGWVEPFAPQRRGKHTRKNGAK